MPDLGERGNVMGPQPIGKVVEPPAEMIAAAERLLRALIDGNRAQAEAVSNDESRGEMTRIAAMVAAGAYDNFEFIGRGRVAKHYFLKARITGPNASPVTVQFRLGEVDGNWQVREILDLSGRRSGWTK
jgi:hypothetical protein